MSVPLLLRALICQRPESASFLFVFIFIFIFSVSLYCSLGRVEKDDAVFISCCLYSLLEQFVLLSFWPFPDSGGPSPSDPSKSDSSNSSSSKSDPFKLQYYIILLPLQSKIIPARRVKPRRSFLFASLRLLLFLSF